jgi:hypothetical protein
MTGAKNFSDEKFETQRERGPRDREIIHGKFRIADGENK